MAKAATLDEDLVSGLKDAKSKRCYFALVLKGSNDGGLIVSKSKVQPTEIADAKKKSGGTSLVSGFCSYKDGTYVFETADNAPATADQAVKNIAKRDAGMTVKAEFRLSNDPELLADQGGKSTGTEKPQQLDDAAVVKRFNSMTADVKAALAGPNKDRVRSLFSAVNDQMGKKVFVKAGALLDELATLVKQSKSGDRPAKDAAIPPKRGTTQPGQKAAVGPLPETAKYETALETWERASAAALSGVNKLASNLQATGDVVALAVVARIESLQSTFPDTLDDALTMLAKSAKSGIAADAELHRKTSENAIKAALAYLNNNAKTINGCETNPFGINVAIRAPLTEALKQVLINVKK